MLCCICPPWRVLCECCLCCECCAIDENGNFIHFMEEDEEEKNTEDFDIKTEDQSSIRSRMGITHYTTDFLSRIISGNFYY